MIVNRCRPVRKNDRTEFVIDLHKVLNTRTILNVTSFSSFLYSSVGDTQDSLARFPVKHSTPA